MMLKGLNGSFKSGMTKIDRKRVIARYWHRLNDGRIQCDLCPRNCKLHEGQSGFCVLRSRIHNQMVLEAYGQSSGFHVDPIEKKPLYHFLPGTSVLSFGTIGCNLACQFCQNWAISFSKNKALLNQPADPQQIVQFAQANDCKSVAFTYNEPITSIEHVIETAHACREANIKSVVVTNGYICDEPRKDFFQWIDAANVDLKFFNEHTYFKISRAHLQPIQDTLEYLVKHTSVWLEITTLLIPSMNDSPEEIDRETKWIAEHLGYHIPLHFTAFFPAWKMQTISPTPLSSLVQARDIAIRNGLRYVYIGNAASVDGSTTFCTHCGKKIIERTNYTLTHFQLSARGECRFCGSLCPGVFEESTPKRLTP